MGTVLKSQTTSDCKELRLGLRFQSLPWVFQPISKPLQRIFPIFLLGTLPTAKKSYKPRWGSLINQWWSCSPGDCLPIRWTSLDIKAFDFPTCRIYLPLPDSLV